MIKKFCTQLACAIAALGLSATAFAAEPEKPKLSIGVGSSILNYAPIAFADSLGYFKQEGLTVTVENFQAGGSKALQALIGGSVDAVVGFYDHTIQMQAKGKDIVAVMLLNDIPGVVFGVRADLADKVKSVKDLKGMRIGVTTPGSSTDMIARYYLAKNGLGPRDVSIIAVGSGAPGMVALEVQTVDALIYFDPIASQLARKKSAKILFDARNVEGSKAAFDGIYPTACLYVSREFLTKNPETVQRLANSFLRTLHWIADASPEKFVDTLPKTWKLDDRSLNLDIAKSSRELFSKTGQFDPKSLKTPLAVLSGFDEAIAKAKIDLSKTYTNQFAIEAAKRIR